MDRFLDSLIAFQRMFLDKAACAAWLAFRSASSRPVNLTMPSGPRHSALEIRGGGKPLQDDRRLARPGRINPDGIRAGDLPAGFVPSRHGHPAAHQPAIEVDWTKRLQQADYRKIFEENCIRPNQLDEEADWNWYVNAWLMTDSPSANAYCLLEDLDIGPELTGENGDLGGIDFIDSKCPGLDYLGVHCEDGLSISLLQAKLNELDTGLALRVAYDSDRT